MFQLHKTASISLLLALTVLISACGTARRLYKQDNPPDASSKTPPEVSTVVPPKIEGTKLYEPPENNGFPPYTQKKTYALKPIEHGMASWYGANFHGQLTANGESYNMHELTAAHRTLPFNTKVLVKNKNNGKSVIVRINDRGPFAKGRIIDLSKKAAREIGMIGPGTVPVQLYVIKGAVDESYTENIKLATYTIQLGSYDTEAQAFEHSRKINGSRIEIAFLNEEKVFRVYYGLYIDKERAYQIQEMLAQKSIEGYVKQIENG